MKKIVVLTGAGISAESGIQTFRDADGLWEGHDVMEVATPEGWRKDRSLVLDFYNQRRKQLKTVKPNEGHKQLVRLESQYEVHIITQNVDDLHERAGSKHILHLHGELKKVRSCQYETLVYDWEEDLNLGDKCEKGSQLRPHIVWFGEAVPMLETAADLCSQADVLLIVGTSLIVYPAAGLSRHVPAKTPIFYIDPMPKKNMELQLLKDQVTIIAEAASTGVKKVVDQLLENV